jgi:hypothetical protein
MTKGTFKTEWKNETNINNNISIPQYLNIFFIILSFSLIMLFFYQYFIAHTIFIHPETYGTLPLQMKESSEIFKQCIPTIFNLDNFEGGAYRPRIVSFLVDYINVNSLPILNKLFPFWSMRPVFTVIAILLSIFAMFVLLNNFFKKIPVGIKLFLSVFPIYFINVQAGLGIYYRTSKFLVIPFALFILNYFYKYFDSYFSKKGIPGVLIAVILLFLSTLHDEQLVFVVFFFCCLSLLYSFIFKKLHNNTVVFATTFIFYLFWYFCLGRYLFSIFTPHPFFKHVHEYKSFLAILNPIRVYDVVILYFNLINNNFRLLLPILIFLLGFSLASRHTEEKTKIWLIPITVLVLSFLLVCVNVFGHPAIINFPDMKFSNYLAPALFLFYFAYIHFSFNIFRLFPYKNFLLGLIFLSMLTVVIAHRHNTGVYYSTHINNATSNGHLLLLSNKEEIEKYNYIMIFDDIIKDKEINQQFIYITNFVGHDRQDD